MSKLQDTIKDLNNNLLTTVNLRSNQIGASGASAIALALQANKSVTTVSLNNNEIGDSGALAIALALQANNSVTSVSLEQNQIGAGAMAIAEALKANKSLTTVSLGYNKIGDSEAMAIAEALQANKSITSVSLVGNQIGDSGASAIAEALKANKSLTSVSLVGNQIGDSGASAIAEALQANKSVTTVSLGQNQIGTSGASAIALALKANNSVTTVDLGYNKIGDSGASAIALALKANNSVTTVDLRSNQIGASGASAIAEALQANNSVTSVSLEQNQIGAGAMAIAEALKANKSLTTVSLGYNKIGDSEAMAIAEALQANKSITSVSLVGNQIGDSGASAIAEALKANKSLTSVSLVGNQIGDSGASAIAEALQANKSVTTVSLGQNQIGTSGASAIALALKANNSVTTVDLGYNKIGDSGAMAIALALQANKSLTTVDLGYNQIGDSGAMAIALALQANKSLTTVYLKQNQIGDALLKTIEELNTALKVQAETMKAQAEQQSARLQSELQTARTQAEQQAPALQAELQEKELILRTAEEKLRKIEELEQLQLNEQSRKDVEKKEQKLAALEEMTHSYCLEEVIELLSAQTGSKVAIDIDLEILDLSASKLSEKKVADLITTVLDGNKVKAIALCLGNSAYAGMLIRKQEDVLQVIYVDPKGNSYTKEENVQALINKINEINEGETKITDLKVKQQEVMADSGAITVENLVLLTNPLNIAKLANLASLKELLPRAQEVEVIRMKHLLIKDTNPYYSNLKMQKLLEIELQDQEVKIFPAAVFEDKKLFAAITQNAVREVIDNSKPVIVPVRDEANHWAGIVVKKQVDGSLQAIYSDPSGKSLMQAKHSGVLLKVLANSNLPFHMFDLQKKQQINDNGEDCGVFTIENLVQLSTNETGSLDITRMKALLPEQDTRGNNGHMLRAKQVKKLNDAGIPTGLVELSRGTRTLDESEKASPNNFDENKDLKSREFIDFARKNPALENANNSNNSNAEEIDMDFMTIDISITGADAGSTQLMNEYA